MLLLSSYRWKVVYCLSSLSLSGKTFPILETVLDCRHQKQHIAHSASGEAYCRHLCGKHACADEQFFPFIPPPLDQLNCTVSYRDYYLYSYTLSIGAF